MSGMQFTQSIARIRGAGFTIDLTVTHNGRRAAGSLITKDGWGKTAGGNLDAGTIDELIRGLTALKESVKAMNGAKKIVIGLDKESIVPRRNPWIRLPWPFGGDPPKVEKADGQGGESPRDNE
jgi:hypothetical protein